MEIKKGRLAKEMEDPYYLKNPNLLELYKKCLPPPEAYLYFPKGEELIEYNKKKPEKSFRKIYHNVPFLEIEKQFIKEFKEFINKYPDVKVPYFIDDALLLRFFYADDGEIEKSFKRLVKYINWSDKTFPLTIQPRSKLIEILNKGFVYAHGRDCRYRPILVFRVQEFVKNKDIYSVEEVIEAGSFLGQFVINNMMIPGQIERWNLIISLKGATLLSLPDHIKKLIPVMNEAFISRLHKNYIIGMTFILRMLYKVVCTFLHESTIKKIRILGGKKDKSLFEEIRKDNIEEYFGGTAPDVKIGEENALFPPRMPSDKFLLENENPQNILISEEEYITKYKNGEIIDDCASPYILEKLNLNKNNENTVVEKQEIIEEIKTQTIPKSNTTTNTTSKNLINHNKIFSMKVNNYKNPKRIERPNSINLKDKNIYKIKSFINNGWEQKEEHINPEKYNLNKYQGNNIIKEIYSLSNKRKNFFRKINSVSKKDIMSNKINYKINGYI